MVRRFSFIIGLLVLSLFASLAYSQTPSRQTYLNSSALLAQNYELLLTLDTNNPDHLKVASTLIADMNAAMSVVEAYEQFRGSRIISAIDGVEDQANALVRGFSNLNNTQMDDQILSTLSNVEDLARQRELYQQSLRNISNLRQKITVAHNFLSKAGNTLSVVDTGIKAKAYIETLQRDAGRLEQFQAEGDFVLSAAATSLAIAAPNALPPVAIASAATATVSWYTDKLGDTVRSGTEARSSIYATSITNAGLTVQNTILRNYRAGTPLSDSEIRILVNDTYSQVKAEIESYRGDIGKLEWFFGVKGVEEDAIDQAVFLVDTILDGRGVDRALRFNNEVEQRISSIEQFNATVMSAVQTGQDLRSDDTGRLREASQSQSVSELDVRREELLNAISESPSASNEERATSVTSDTNEDAERFAAEQERLEQERQAELDRQEAERLEQERQEIIQRRIALVNERNGLVQEQDGISNQLTDAQARLQEARNQLAVSRFNDLEIVDRDLNRIRSELAALSRRAGDQTETRDLGRERSILIRGAEIVRQLYLGRIDINDLTRTQRNRLTLMGRALGYTTAGGKPIWETVAENARFTAQRIVGRVNAIDSELSRLNPLSSSEQRRLDELRRTERRLTSDKREILATIDRAERDIERYQGTIASLESRFDQNEQRLTQLGYDIENYVPPTFVTGPQTDWANYESRYTPLEEETADTSDERDETAVDIASAVDPDNPNTTVTLPNGVFVTGNGSTGVTTTPGVTGGSTTTTGGVVPGDSGSTTTGTTGGGFNPNNFELVGHFGAITTVSGATQPISHTANTVAQDSSGTTVLSFVRKINGGEEFLGIEANNSTSGSFQHLQWGRYGSASSDSPFTYFSSAFNRDFTVESVHWVYGTPTPSSTMENRTGTATWVGNLIGDYAVEGQPLRVGAISGELGFGVDFSTKDVTGQGYFKLDGASWDSFTIAGDFETGKPINGTNNLTYAGIDTVLKNQQGNNAGYLDGTFYGSSGQEFGGRFWYFGPGGTAAGIAVAQEGPIPNQVSWGGFLAAKVTGQSSLFTRNITDVTGVNNPSPGIPKTGFVKVEANGLVPSITTHVKDEGYEYTSWGQWNGTGVSIDSQPIEHANVVIGQFTEPSAMPSSGTRNFGGATHNSQVAGIGFNGEQIGGTISLGADFSNGHIGGQFDFTADGNQWVNGTISNTPIQGNRFNGNGSNMNIDQGGSGNLSGAFFGDSAQEVAGEWAIWNVPGAVSGADGVFRAKQ